MSLAHMRSRSLLSKGREASV